MLGRLLKHRHCRVQPAARQVAGSGGNVSPGGTWGAVVQAALARWEFLGQAWEALGSSGSAVSVPCLETPGLVDVGA